MWRVMYCCVQCQRRRLGKVPLIGARPQSDSLPCFLCLMWGCGATRSDYRQLATARHCPPMQLPKNPKYYTYTSTSILPAGTPLEALGDCKPVAEPAAEPAAGPAATPISTNSADSSSTTTTTNSSSSSTVGIAVGVGVGLTCLGECGHAPVSLIGRK